MPWTLCVYLQQRGTKEEVCRSVSFSSKSDAFAAARRIESDVRDAEPDDSVSVNTGDEYLGFLKQDFRSVTVFESGFSS